MSEGHHWSDTSKDARTSRDVLRTDFRLGLLKPQTDEKPDAAERFPQEYFKCRACNTGPWHITWGAICPNCSGA